MRHGVVAEFVCRRSRSRRLVRAAASGLLVVCCAAFAADAASGASKPLRHAARSLITLHLGYVSVADPLMLAMVQNGTFLKNGLNVQLTQFLSGVPEVAALASNNIDIGYTAAPPLISLAAQGVKVHAVAIGDWSSPANALIVGKNSGITSIAQLKGKTIGVLEGSILQYSLQQMLATAGLSVSDVQMVNIQTQLMPAALENGDVDAVYTNQVPSIQLESAGYKVLKKESAVPAAGIGGITYWVATDSFAQQNPAAMQDFMRAMYQTQQELAKKASLAPSLFQSYFGLTPAQSKTLAKRITIVPLEQQLSSKYAYNLNHGGMARELTPVISFMQSLDQITQPVSSSTLLDPSYMEKFVASLAPKKKKKK